MFKPTIIPTKCTNQTRVNRNGSDKKLFLKQFVEAVCFPLFSLAEK